MPHPKYLQKFTMKMGPSNSGLNESQVKYLSCKCLLLKENEKMVDLLLDVVYIKPDITYKNGKLEGA